MTRLYSARFDGARRVEREKLDQRADAELRDSADLRRPAARARWPRRRARRSCGPRSAGAGRDAEFRRAGPRCRSSAADKARRAASSSRKRCCRRSPACVCARQSARATASPPPSPWSASTRVRLRCAARDADSMRSQGSHADQSSRSPAARRPMSCACGAAAIENRSATRRSPFARRSAAISPLPASSTSISAPPRVARRAAPHAARRNSRVGRLVEMKAVGEARR